MSERLQPVSRAKQHRLDRDKQKEQDKRKKGQTRGHQRLALAGVGLAMLAATALSPLRESVTSFISDLVIPAASTELAEYPEMRKYPIQEQGSFRTPKREIAWFNYTNTYLNEQSVSDLYHFLEKPVSPTPLTLVFNNGALRLLPQDSARRDLSIFVTSIKHPFPGIKPDAPHVDYNQFSKLKDPTGFTHFRNAAQTVTYIRIDESITNRLGQDLFNPNYHDANEILAAEACMGTKGFAAANTATALLGKDLMCNTIGDMISFRQKNLSYEQYVHNLTTPKKLGNALATIPTLPREEFDKVPVFTRFFTPKP